MTIEIERGAGRGNEGKREIVFVLPPLSISPRKYFLF